MRDCVMSSLRGGRISHRLMWRHRQQDRSAHGWTVGDQKPLELSAQNSSQSFRFFLHNTTTTVRDSASSCRELKPSAGPPLWSLQSGVRPH